MLELGILPVDIQMEEVGERVMWGAALELALEGPPLAPLMEVLIEESGITLMQEDDATVDDEAAE